MPSHFLDVDPRELRVPSSREGADPVKLARQISRFGASAVGMPPIVAYEGTDGFLLIYDGVTRATRIAKLAPGTLVRVEAGPENWRLSDMIPSTKSEALAVLAEVCEMSPDIRLGQLLAHLGFLGEDQTGRSLWNIDDEQLLAVLYSHRAELALRTQDTPNQTLSPTAPVQAVSARTPASDTSPAQARR